MKAEAVPLVLHAAAQDRADRIYVLQMGGQVRGGPCHKYGDAPRATWVRAHPEMVDRSL